MMLYTLHIALLANIYLQPPLPPYTLPYICGHKSKIVKGYLEAVDADGLAVEVDERPARVAEGDGRVSLDVVLDVPTLPKYRPHNFGS